jgi:hypothetical protein
MDLDGDGGGVACKGLVDAVVHDLIHHVVQTRAVVGVADIHARAFPDSLQPLENLDGIGGVFVELLCGFGHADPFLFLCAIYSRSLAECHAMHTIFGVRTGR